MYVDHPPIPQTARARAVKLLTSVRVAGGPSCRGRAGPSSPVGPPPNTHCLRSFRAARHTMSRLFHNPNPLPCRRVHPLPCRRCPLYAPSSRRVQRNCRRSTINNSQSSRCVGRVGFDEIVDESRRVRRNRRRSTIHSRRDASAVHRVPRRHHRASRVRACRKEGRSPSSSSCVARSCW